MITLSYAIRALVDYARDMEIDDFEDAISAASDDLETGEKTYDRFTDSVLDGIRWGLRAAVTVELDGGTILRVRKPGGVGITHEWHGSPRSAIGRASIMQTVDEAMGVEGGARAVLAVWDEAARAQAEAIRARLAEVAADDERYDAYVLRHFDAEIVAMMEADEQPGKNAHD